MRHIGVAATFVITLTCIVASAEDAISEKDAQAAAGLIARLGSDHYQTRVDAEAALNKLMPAAAKQLRGPTCGVVPDDRSADRAGSVHRVADH